MPSRVRVLVDMDGVLADFDGYFWERCLAQGWQFDCKPHEQMHHFATEHLVNKADRQAARVMVNNDPDWFINLPPIPGALEGVEELAEVADVWLCTKPLEANPWCRDAKAEWVTEHLGVEWVKRLIIAPDKSLIRGDVLLDDAIKPEWVPRAEWTPVVFDAPFNGPGSEWEDWPHWNWGDNLLDLLSGSGRPREVALA